MNDVPAPPRGDWLLASARIVIAIMMFLTCLTGLGLIAAGILLPVFHEQIFAKLAEHGELQFGSELIPAMEAIFAVFLAMMVLAFQWLRQLRRIVGSVGVGEAFTLDNAARLTQMGWLTVAIEALAIPGGAIVGFIAKHIHHDPLPVSLSLEGVLMALVLFILARVFREGAAMRDELEGTV